MLLVDSSVIGNLTASGRNVSVLRRMASPSPFVCVWNRAEICGTWLPASWRSTALNAPHVAVTSCVGQRHAPPAFHCRSDNRYCEWRRLLASDSGQSKDGLGLPKRGKRQHPRERLWESNEPRVHGYSRFAWD